MPSTVSCKSPNVAFVLSGPPKCSRCLQSALSTQKRTRYMRCCQNKKKNPVSGMREICAKKAVDRIALTLLHHNHLQWQGFTCQFCSCNGFCSTMHFKWDHQYLVTDNLYSTSRVVWQYHTYTTAHHFARM